MNKTYSYHRTTQSILIILNKMCTLKTVSVHVDNTVVSIADIYSGNTMVSYLQKKMYGVILNVVRLTRR